MSAIQDYSTYHKDDGGGTEFIGTFTIDVLMFGSIYTTALDTDTNTRIYKDFGASYFSSDFECSLILKITSASTATSNIYPWAMSNSAGNIGTLRASNTDLHYLKWSNGTLILGQRNDAVDTTDTSVALSLNTLYYLRIVRDEEVGTYGTLYCHIYTDPEYTILIDTLVVTLTENKDWQYLYAMSGEGNGAGGDSISGSIQCLRIDPYPYSRKNLRLRVRDILNEDIAGIGQYPCWNNVQLNYLLDEGQRDISSKAKCIKKIYSSSVDNSNSTVFIGTAEARKAEMIEYVPGGAVKSKSLRRINPKFSGHRILDGIIPQFFFETQFGNYQKAKILPLVGSVTYNVNVYNWQGATDFAADSYTSNLPPAFQPLLILYCCYRAYEQKNLHPQAAQFRSMYEAELAFLTQEYCQPIPDGMEEYSNR